MKPQPCFNFYRTEQHFVVTVTQLQHVNAGTRAQLVADRTTGQVRDEVDFNPLQAANLPRSALDQLKVFAFLGALRVPSATLWTFVTDVSVVAEIGANRIYQVKGVELIPVNPCWRDPGDMAVVEEVKRVRGRQFLLGDFYFCDSYNLTNSLQRAHGKKGKLHSTADQSFYWNRDMYSELISQGISEKWFIPIIYGYVGSCKEFYGGTQVEITLISRRACGRGGTQEAEWGVDDEGNVANFVETEQIVHILGTWHSFLQVRGTLPVFWTMSGPTYSARSTEATVPAFTRHFDGLIEKYEHVMVINLLSEGKPEEQVVNGLFNELMRMQQHKLERTVGYYPFDFRIKCKGDRQAELSTLLTNVSDMLTYYWYFSLTNGQVQSSQRGVPRINCLDCLDRTNATMARIAWEILVRQFSLSDITISLDYDDTLLTHPLLRAIRSLWADNGDALSREYIGVTSGSARKTRTGKGGLKGLFDMGMKKVEKMLAGGGEKKQEMVELMLGYTRPRHVISPAVIQREDEYIKRLSISVHVCTWNLAGNRPPDSINLSDWLIDPECPMPELVVVGLQEMLKLNTKNVLAGSNQPLVDAWQSIILATLNAKRRAHYVPVQSQDMVGCLICLFAQDHMLSHLKSLTRDTVKVGFGNMAGNKGAVLVRLQIEDTCLVFWNCHLESGMEQTEARLRQLEDICERGFAGCRRGKQVSEHDVKVLMGDLNFRISLRNTEVRPLISSRNYSRLLQFDQLQASQPLHPVLSHYQEGTLSFAPTYKYDPNSDEYDTSKKMRVPAWCDRVLYSGKGVVLVSYRRTETRYSDHRPVSATVVVPVKRILGEKRKEVEEQERMRRGSAVGLQVASIRPRGYSEVGNRTELLDLGEDDAAIRSRARTSAQYPPVPSPTDSDIINFTLRSSPNP